MTPGKPVPETTARHAIGTVFAVCAAVAAWAFSSPLTGPLEGLLAASAGLVGYCFGAALASVPYWIRRPGA